MRRIGALLTIILAVLVGMAGPALAAPADGSQGHRGTRAHGDGAGAQTSEAGTTSAQDSSGNGMNRQGGASEHPGAGWKDPGQDQGSPTNTADPDCTGNRTDSPQETNIGACDDPSGAADKPVSDPEGGFDADRDWNNGCGNDTDFEDDNNGLCLGPTRRVQPPPPPPPPPPAPPAPPPPPPAPPAPPAPPPPAPPPPPSFGGDVVQPPAAPPALPPTVVAPPAVTPPAQPASPAVPPVVLSSPDVTPPPVVARPAPQPVPGRLAATGASAADLSATALALIGLGTIMLRRRTTMVR